MPDEIAIFEYVAALLADPGSAEPCSTFPLDAGTASSPGVYAFHGDAEADQLLGAVLGEQLHPLLVEPAGGMSFRTRRASSATLKSAVGRTHLRGNTQSSSFRRSLASVLWKELGLRCDRPKRLAGESNDRLTAWMLEHLSVVTVPFEDRWLLTYAVDFSSRWVNPPFNLSGYGPSPARTVIRRRRRRYFSLATADDDRIRRIADMERLVALDPDGSDFLRRRIVQEFEKLHTEWAS